MHSHLTWVWADTGVVKVSHDDRGLETQGCSYLSAEALIRWFFRVRAHIADIRYNVTFFCPLFRTMSSQLAPHPSPGRAPCTPAALSHQGPLCLIFPPCPSIATPWWRSQPTTSSWSKQHHSPPAHPVHSTHSGQLCKGAAGAQLQQDGRFGGFLHNGAL